MHGINGAGQKGSRKLPGVDGLRALSVVAVIAGHIVQFSGRGFVPFLSDGQFGVTIFFVISGFLITTLLIREQETTGAVSLKKFYLRRIFRIFPAYYFLLFVYLLLQFSGIISIDKYSWLSSITFTKYFNWDRDIVSAHLWSLSVEEHFYLIWPVIFVYGKKYRKIFCYFVLLVVPLIHTVGYARHIYLFNDLTFFARADSLMTGCLFAFYTDDVVKFMKGRWNLFFVLAVAVLLVFDYAPFLEAKYNVHLGFLLVPLGTNHGTVANICIMFVLAYSVYGPHNLWSRFLNARPLVFIGALSYSLYLWQQLFIGSKLPFNLIEILACALFSYYAIERPFLRLKAKFASNTGRGNKS